MTISELHKKLQDLGVPPDLYYLHGLYGSSDDNDKQALIIKKGKYSIEYEVYYKERGQKNSEYTFFDENEACEYLLKRIKDGWILNKINEIDGFQEMNIQERLNVSGYLDEFNNCKVTNKTRAIHILRFLQIDERTIKENLK